MGAVIHLEIIRGIYYKVVNISLGLLFSWSGTDGYPSSPVKVSARLAYSRE